LVKIRAKGEHLEVRREVIDRVIKMVSEGKAEKGGGEIIYRTIK
jgi:hypothetical protein